MTEAAPQIQSLKMNVLDKLESRNTTEKKEEMPEEKEEGRFDLGKVEKQEAARQVLNAFKKDDPEMLIDTMSELMKALGK